MIDDMMKELVQTLTRYISDSYLKTLLEDYQEVRFSGEHSSY